MIKVIFDQIVIALFMDQNITRIIIYSKRIVKTQHLEINKNIKYYWQISLQRNVVININSWYLIFQFILFYSSIMQGLILKDSEYPGIFKTKSFDIWKHILFWITIVYIHI